MSLTAATPTVHWYLENFSFFNILSEEDRVKLGGVAVKHFLPKDTEIYCSGDIANSFYLIKEGKVKITRRSDAGKEIILAILGAGEVFGELSIAGYREREEKAITAEDSLVCLFKVCDFQPFMDKNPRLSLQITKLIGFKLKRIQRRLESLIFRTSEERVRDFIRELATGYGYTIGLNPNEVAIPVRLTHDDIGKLTATSRQTVTTLLNCLSKAGVLTYDRHRIYIKAMDRL